MPRLNARFGALEKETFEAFVFKGTDHEISVTWNATSYNVYS